MSIYGSHSPIEDTVLTYQGSHVYPDAKHHKPASVGLATIPPWCIPGNDRDQLDGLSAPWVRLDLATWSPKWGQPMSGEGSTVVLSVEALRELVQDAAVTLCAIDPDPEHRCEYCYDVRGPEWIEADQ